MSINVTVTGNPVSIKHGKMTTGSLNPDSGKKEFDKRRRIRLEQVRQQSKEIAESVRNRVRNEKKKQLSDIEKHGKTKLKEWQARKLLDLQNQYQESLKDIGLGHIEAGFVNKVDELLELQKENEKQKAKERGERAYQNLQREQSERNMKDALKFDRQKFARDIENKRSVLVSNLSQKKKSPFKRKKRKTKIPNVNVSIESKVTSSSDVESDIPEFLNLSAGDSSSTTPTKCKVQRKSADTRSNSPSSNKYTHSSAKNSSCEEKNENMSFTQDKSQHFMKSFTSGRRSKSPTISEENVSRKTSVNYPLNTRISDRIRSRTFHSSDDQTCDNYLEESIERRHVVYSNPCSKTNLGETNTLKSKSGTNPLSCSKTCYDDCSKLQSHSKETSSKNLQDLPTKPTISLKSDTSKGVKSKVHSLSQKGDSGKFSKATEMSHTGTDVNKVHYYDHSNRFTKQYVPSGTQVEKINEDSIEVLPSNGSETEFINQMYKRDREAELRGQKALEKERIHRDYQELIQKLPALQKQERIANINSDKQTYHMSDERLKEYERKRQNRIDNAYEQLFPPLKPSIITIPPKEHPKEDDPYLPFKTIDADKPMLNLASWDVDTQPLSKAIFEAATQEALLNITDEPSNNTSESEFNKQTNRREQLKTLLANLKQQKDKLLEEVKSLPDGSNLDSLVDNLNVLEAFEKSKVEKKVKTRSKAVGNRSRSRSSEKTPSPSTSTNESPSELKKQNYKERHKKCLTNKYDKSPKKKGKLKTRKQLLILQNTSTQTSPKHAVKERKKLTDESSVPKLQVRVADTVERVVNNSAQSSTSQSSKPLLNAALSQKTHHHHPCSCSSTDKQTDSDKLCEIVIKIRENDKEPEIIVSPKSKPKKVISPTKDSAKSKYPEKVEKQHLWKDHFTQNITSNTSTSTSYMSPPDFTKGQRQHLQQHPQQNLHQQQNVHQQPNLHQQHHHLLQQQENLHKQHHHLLQQQQYDQHIAQQKDQLSKILHRKPQQSNLVNSRSISPSQSETKNLKNLDPRLINYIKKLLSMSRTSIDELTVSTVSDPSTPSHSVVEVNSNNPLTQLQNVMKFFNINMSDIEQYLQPSSDGNQTHHNTMENFTLSSSEGSNFSNEKKTTCSCEKNKTKTPLQDSSIRTNKSTSSDVRNMSLEDHSKQNYSKIMSQYSTVADSCNKRILDLNAMIEKVRQEKLQMLKSPNGSGSDKENSTTYLDLPKNMGQAQESSSKNSSFIEQEELTRKLLEIDYSLAEKLKNLALNTTQQESNKDDLSETDKELLLRFKKLLETGDKSDIHKSQAKTTLATSSANKTDNMPFVPLLLDIPKLPKLTVPTLQHTTNSNQNHRKPPLAKGLVVAKRFNEAITTIPHELSTIVEADSQISTRLHRTNSQDEIKSNRSNSPRQEIDYMNTLKPVIVFPNQQQEKYYTVRQVSADNQTVPPSRASSPKSYKSPDDNSVPDILTELIRHAKNDPKKIKEPRHFLVEKVSNGNDEKSDQSIEKNSELGKIESMLKSMGMGWAVATLRKTQEALALTSSSSSLDFSIKQEIKFSDSSSTSELSLKKRIDKQFRLSGGMSNENILSTSILKEIADMSTIEGSSGSYSQNQQRTSTPILNSRSLEKTSTNVLFTGESDLSSVKVNTDEPPK